MTIVVHHDFETFSRVDIKKAGGHKYARDPSTEVLMLAYAVGRDRPQIWVPAEGEPMPVDLLELTTDPEVEWHAFNAQFERLIWWHVIGRTIPLEQFHCTMQHAWSLSFSGGLAQVGEQLGLPDASRKMARGHKLMLKFSTPAPKNHLADRYTHENAPEDWADFKRYCLQDVIAEREIEMLLAGYPIPRQERDLWLWDQDVNDRGVPVDLSLVNRAVHVNNEAKAAAREELESITYLNNPNSNAQLQAWLFAHGVDAPNMQADTLRKIQSESQDPAVRQALDLKMQLGKTSVSKWNAFKAATCDDGLVRGMFQFAGAQRTQRWAGRIVQLHNLKSPTIEDPVTAAEDLYLESSLIELLHGNPLDFLSEVIRCAITAPDGCVLTPVDLSSIESRVLGYIANCARINATFAAGMDTYKDFASEYYGVPYAQVTGAQRKFSKPPVLGCGYMLGAGKRPKEDGSPPGKQTGLIAYAEGYGVDMSYEDAKRAVDTWRAMNWEVADMWSWLGNACQDTTEHWTVHEGYCVRTHRDKNFLMIDLPSGRSLHYYVPMVLAKIPPWEQDRIDAGEIKPADAKTRPTLTYMGMNQNVGKWMRLTTHPGKITENIVQAIARDVLSFHMLRIESDLGPIIRAHVHDEAVPLVPESEAREYLAHCESVMRIPPPWAPGILLDAKGFITKRYTKD